MSGSGVRWSSSYCLALSSGMLGVVFENLSEFLFIVGAQFCHGFSKPR